MMLIEDFLDGVDVFSTNKSWNPWNGNLELLPGGDHMPGLHAGFVMQAILCGGNWCSCKGCKSLAVDDILLLCPSYPCELDSPRFVYIYIFALLVAHFWLKRDQRSLVHKTYSVVCLSEVIVRWDTDSVYRNRNGAWSDLVSTSQSWLMTALCVCVCDRWWWT